MNRQATDGKIFAKCVSKDLYLLTKEDNTHGDKHIKDIQHQQPSGKLKPQYNTTTYSLEWLKIERVTVPSMGKDVQKQALMVLMVKWYNHFGKQFDFFFFFLIKHIFTILPSYSTCQYLPKRQENTHLQEDLYTNFHSNITYSQKLEMTQMFLNR